MKSIVKQFLSYRYHHPRRLFSTIKVSAKDVKTLREQTGAPMMECKKALSHEDVRGDIEKAIKRFEPRLLDVVVEIPLEQQVNGEPIVIIDAKLRLDKVTHQFSFEIAIHAERHGE